MQPQEISQQHPLLPHLMAYPDLAKDSDRSPPPAPNKAGQVFTFGSAVGGELGLGPDTHERRKPGLLKRLPPIVAIECGGQHTLALDVNGRVYSWGVNDQGALGRITVDVGDDYDEDDEPKGTEAFLPLPVDIPEPVVQMVCADSFSAVLTRSGQVYAWGSFRDPSGVIGFSKQLARESQKLPIKITAFGNERVVLLGSGENHIFAVTSDETVWAFGANDENQLGRRVSSRFKNNLQPYEIRGTGRLSTILHGIVKITGGAYHTLFINNRGELYSFGCNNCGQLGLGDTFSHVNGPERVMFAIDADNKTRIPLPPIVDIAAGESHSIAVSNDGRVFTWGANLESQLGYVSFKPIYGDQRDSPVSSLSHNVTKNRKRKSMDDEDVSTSSSSAHSSPQKKSDFKLKFQPLPRQIPPSASFDYCQDPIVAVDAQSRFSIAVSSQGNLYTWGSGHSFQLGNEEMEDETTPFKVELKTRRCFWARCGGQFTMFVLEPKRSETETKMESTPPPANKNTFMDYRATVEPVTSAPGSVVNTPSDHHTTPVNKKQRVSGGDHSSPTSSLVNEMHERLQSPDGKKRQLEAKAATHGEAFLKSPEKSLKSASVGQPTRSTAARRLNLRNHK